MNCIFFLVWKQTGYFYQFKMDIFTSFWARVKYFDGPCLIIHSFFTIYRDIHYQLLVWWSHYNHCCKSKKWKPGIFQLCSLWNDIFNISNWRMSKISKIPVQIDRRRTLVEDPYLGTWTRTPELWIWPVLIYVLRFPSMGDQKNKPHIWFLHNKNSNL